VDDDEAAVRAYLLYLEDPSKLRDEREVQRLTSAVLAAEDPIEKLKALAALKAAARVDGDALRAGFVAGARRWADEHGIPGSAFSELGVEDDVLVEAGFEPPPPRTGGRRRAARPRSAGGRARRTNVEDVRAAVLERSGPFVLTDVVADSGASPQTVRKVVEDLVGAGQVTRLGPVPDHHARGRAPVRYEVRPGG
jgi:hypothetical protein